MNWSFIFGDYSFYWLSFLAILPFLVYYYKSTIKKDKDIFWFIYEDGEKKMDLDFLKKAGPNLIQLYFTFFAFLNVIYFVFAGKWYSEDNYKYSMGFVLIAAVMYIINLIEKATNIVPAHRQKKIKIGKESIKQEK